MSFSASAPRLNFAMSTAPASSRRRTTTESVDGNPVAERLGAVGRRDTRGVEQILHAKWNPVKWPAVSPGSDLSVRLLRLRESAFPVERDDAAQLRIELLNPPKIDAGSDARM